MGGPVAATEKRIQCSHAVPRVCNAPALDVEAALKAIGVDQEREARLSYAGPPVPRTCRDWSSYTYNLHTRWAACMGQMRA